MKHFFNETNDSNVLLLLKIKKIIPQADKNNEDKYYLDIFDEGVSY